MSLSRASCSMSIKENGSRKDVIGAVAVGGLQKGAEQDEIDRASGNLFRFPGHFQNFGNRRPRGRFNEQIEITAGMLVTPSHRTKNGKAPEAMLSAERRKIVFQVLQCVFRHTF